MGEGQKVRKRTIAMIKMDSKQGSGFRVQGSGFSCQQNSSLISHPSSFIPHPSSFILHPIQKSGNKLPCPRRGVLLLLVLAILALFALVAVAFVIISGQSQRSAKNMQRVDQTLEDPQKLLNEAMMQVARGPSNPISVLGLHSLLEDMYGNNSVIAKITPLPAVAGGQLIEFTYLVLDTSTNPPTWNTDPNPQYRLGCVLTFLDSSLMGESTRIVGMNPTNGNYQMLATGPILAGNITPDTQVLINGAPFSGTGFGFNPATGKLDLAINPSTYQLTTTPSATTWPVALLPNLPFSTYYSAAPTLITNPQSNPPGGANEDYDAADYQNMLLATPLLPSATGSNNIPSLHRPALVNYWNTTRTTDWNSNPDPNVQKLLHRKVILRPTEKDHPDFTGSNPNVTTAIPWDPVIGPWDVDNDGDGVPDSIWVDLGLPVRAAKDGKLYKPLFAILCEDMDGRLNLNAHGDLEQTNAGYYPPAGTPPDPINYPDEYFANHTSLPTNRGQGFGPADINLYYTLYSGVSPDPFNDSAGRERYQRLLSGSVTTGIEGRYGTDGVPAAAGSAYFQSLGAAGNSFAPGVGSYNDYLSANKWFEYDSLYKNSILKTSYPSADLLKNVASDNKFSVNSFVPDPQAKYVVGLDPAGRPILQSYNQTDKFDVPYELNLGLKTQRGLQSPSSTPDNPFSVDELERILRPYDRDAAQLPARLAALTSTSGIAPYSDSVLIPKRHEVTTESWDVPVFSAGLPPHILTRVQGDLSLLSAQNQQIVQAWIHPQHITDLLKAYFYYQILSDPISPYYSPPGDPNRAANVNNAAPKANNMVNLMTSAQLYSLFAPEMLAGLKLNINRPFPGPGTGAGTDPNAFGKAALWQSLGAGGSYGDFWFGQMPEFPDTNNNVGNYFTGVTNITINKVQFPARQLYARYLYVLAMLLRDKNPPPATLHPQAQLFTETLSDTNKEKLFKRRIAQWAINAACFQTNDSIMAPFEYDLDPLGIADYTTIPMKPNYWRVDGIIDSTSADNAAADRGLVWGCKPPELILTETLAFHDRRIANTVWDPTGKKYPPAPGDTEDDDFDQTRVPQGSAFFELYCPRDLHGSTPPPDLYDKTTNQLDLGRLAPADVNGVRYPVWRLVIGASNMANSQNNVVTDLTTNPDTFTPQTQQYVDAPHYLQYSQTADETSLLPKGFSATTQITIDRIVWFANLQPITKLVNPAAYHADADLIYYNQPGTPVLLDRGHYAVVGPRMTTTLGLTNNITGNPAYIKLPIGEPSKQVISLPAPDSPIVKNLNDTWDANIDKNMIKMPLGIIASNSTTGWATNLPVGVSISEPLFSKNYYSEPKLAGPDGVKEWYGDWQMTDPSKGYFLDTPLDIQAGMPLADDKIGYDPTTSSINPTPSTTTNYKTVFLQRLANPSAPYEPMTNPYMTVDWMPVDLTVFNGDDSTDPYDVGPPRFATRQRGNAASNYNIWAPVSDDPNISAIAGSAAYFDYNLVHSLGYLNQAFQPFMSPVDPAELRGDPATQPFPWLPWCGRPYVSQLELMLVPATHPARLLLEFQPCTAGTSNYNLSQSNPPFPELLNFMQMSNTSVTPNLNQFSRILDYVGVPSLFEGTEIQADPNLISPPDVNGNGIPQFPGSHTFFPPYNNISTYREPGRINLNTIYSQDVYNGLMNGVALPKWFDLTQPFDFVRNRRGYGTSDSILEKDPSHPTEFLKPFRSSGGSFFWDTTDIAPHTEINATYMRQGSAASNNPLFQQYPALQQDVNNTDRNPFFHYQGLERLGNLVTTRSNVYSVWITVGYFEVKPKRKNTLAGETVDGIPDAAHPDGYELGQEMGSDTGEIVRHRAFYMIDRTIPVGFQRGQDLNVEKAIILKRYIE